MEVAKLKTDRKIFFCILAHCAINFLGDLYYSVTALCKWNELCGNRFLYEIKCSRLAFMNRSCLTEAGNYPAADCSIEANTWK